MIDVLANAAISMIEVRVATCCKDNAQRLFKAAFTLAEQSNNGKAVVAHALLVGMCSILTLKKARINGAKASDTNYLIFSLADAEPYAAMSIAAMVATFEHQKADMPDDVISFELAWARHMLEKLEDEMREAHLMGAKS